MQIFPHADDLGLSRSINEGILDCVDHGALAGVSLVANGAAFGHAVDALRNRPQLRVSVHLNLCEGEPLSSPDEVSLLIDRDGRFHYSFVALWLRYLLAPPSVRRLLRRQVACECGAQVRTAFRALGRASIGVDGHQHFHLLPFVFDAVLDLATEVPIAHVRMPGEPFVWLQGAPAAGSRHGGLRNLAKYLVLRAFGALARGKLENASLASTDHLVGVLFSGRITRQAIEASLERIRRESRRTPISVEVLFHPGRASASESHLWSSRPSLREFYCSPDRCREAEELKNPELASMLRRFAGA